MAILERSVISELREKQREIEKEFENLQHEEEALIGNMKNLLTQKTYVDGKIKSLSKILPTLKSIKQEAKSLVETIHGISNSSEEISGKIRTYDIARSRVDECQQRVGDLIDLELCSEGVQKAILEEDYEQGAAHVHRFLSMDQSLLQRTASDVENISGVLRSVRTLQDATEQLRAIVKHKFDDAVKQNELSSIERFFKIFPLLGMYEEGITDFCNYLCRNLENTAEKNLHTALNTSMVDKRYHIVYSDALTLLFEGLARIIDQHQPLIETYYGPGRLLSAVKILQNECDRQTRRIFMEFNKNRQVNKKISHINDIAKMSASSSFSKIEKSDPKDLDILIGEMTVMHARMELYIKFIRRKISSDIEVGIQNDEDKKNALNNLELLIKNSMLTQNKHELLGNYLRLEQYFMEESISKAFSMDSIDTEQNTSSMVDDTFFIVRKCIRRSISTASLDGICTIINNACNVLESDFCQVLRMKLKQGYTSGYLDLTQAYNVLQTSLQQGRLQPSDAEQTRIAFIVALNNADNSIEYVEALCDSVLQEIEMAITNMKTNDRGKLESCLSGLSSVTANLRDVIDYGIQHLRGSVVKPRVNPWVDAFSNISHQFSEVEMSIYEAGESFVETLIMNLESLLSPFKNILTSANYDALVSIVTAEVTARLEKVVLKSTYNRLGGLILDKEIRSLSAYLTTSTSWSVRDKFARLVQIATILNLEKVTEIADYWGNHDGALTWRLTPSEVRTILSLRTDFKIDEIRRLKL